MGNLFWLTAGQIRRLQSFFPESRGRAQVDDLRVLSGIILVDRNCSHWRNVTAANGPAKTLYHRWVRWSRMRVFARMLIELAAEGRGTGALMLDAVHLKVHRTAASLRAKKVAPATGAVA